MIWTHDDLAKVGFKPAKVENPDFVCRKCGSDDVWYAESDGDYDDVLYHCVGCNRRWWVEGADY